MYYVTEQHSQPLPCDKNIWASIASALADHEPSLLAYFVPSALRGYLNNRYLLIKFEKIKHELVCSTDQICVDINCWQGLKDLTLLLHSDPTACDVVFTHIISGVHWGIYFIHRGKSDVLCMWEVDLTSRCFSVPLWNDQVMEHTKFTACKMDGFCTGCIAGEVACEQTSKQTGNTFVL